MKKILIASVLFVAGFCFGVEQAKPNVLFIAVDDLVPTLGCYGDERVISPNIDKLAGQGTTFLRAQCQWPVCGPSRASIMSGLRPETTGVMNLKTKWRISNPGIVSLPEHLKQHGYFTTGTGKIYDRRCVDSEKIMDKESWSEPYTTSPGGYPKGDADNRARDECPEGWNKLASIAYDTEMKNFQDYRIAQHGLKLMRERAAAEQPFFLAVGFKKPHLAFVSPKKYWDMYAHDSIEVHAFQEHAADSSGFGPPDMNEIRSYYPFPKEGHDLPVEVQKQLIHGYLSCVTFIDDLIGSLLNELEALGLKENTIVVLWGDHGFHLGDHGYWGKHSTFEQAARVPLIIVDPRMKKSGQTTVSPAEFTDVFPTLCELTGVPVLDQLQGVSLVPVMNDPEVKVRKGATTLYKSTGKKGALGYSYRTERYRYIEWINRYSKKVVGRDLYDYEKDPFETQSLAKNPKYTTIMQELAEGLYADAEGWKLLETSLNARSQRL
ncbi:MAG: sulfatase [Opitutales bacterium]